MDMMDQDILLRLARPSRRARALTPRVRTSGLFAKGEDAILRKVLEEAAETLLASKR